MKNQYSVSGFKSEMSTIQQQINNINNQQQQQQQLDDQQQQQQNMMQAVSMGQVIIFHQWYYHELRLGGRGAPGSNCDGKFLLLVQLGKISFYLVQSNFGFDCVGACFQPSVLNVPTK